MRTRGTGDYAKVARMRRHFDRREPLALAALFAGAAAIASSGIFVRLSETGPTATGFWRGALMPLIGAFYLAFTVASAIDYWRGRGGMWKGRAQAIPAPT